MIADTTFLSDFHHEREATRRGPASRFMAARRSQSTLVTVISVGEIAVLFESNQAAREFLGPFRLLRLTPEIAYIAAQIDREQIAVGARLGENDNWIAGFCRYYGQPLISRDRGFDVVRGLRRLAY
jgi:predicted nucleic acid-binding protein